MNTKKHPPAPLRAVVAVCFLDAGLAQVTLECRHAFMGSGAERLQPCRRCAELGALDDGHRAE